MSIIDVAVASADGMPGTPPEGPSASVARILGGLDAFVCAQCPSIVVKDAPNGGQSATGALKKLRTVPGSAALDRRIYRAATGISLQDIAPDAADYKFPLAWQRIRHSVSKDCQAPTSQFLQAGSEHVIGQRPGV
ncbi:MAG: hypothetical protein JWO59_1064 [Chloroflexi bacterium]|nr:hypothetical protein [Chloroflexota bacterium]